MRWHGARTWRSCSDSGGDTITANITVTNTGARRGADVLQLYLTDAAGEPRTRLLGFERVELGPGQSHRLTLAADPRLLARYDDTAGQGHIAGGTYRVAVGKAVDNLQLTAETHFEDRWFGS